MIKGKDYEIIDGHLKIFDGATKIEDHTFDLKGLISVEMPDTITYIGDCAFQRNKLKCIKFPPNLTNLGQGVFAENEITQVEIPKWLKVIRCCLFRENGIVNLEIPSTVEIIEDSAFEENNITNLKIENGVKKIKSRAFFNNNLNIVEIPDSVVEIETLAFDYIDVVYKGIKLEKELIQKYGCENIKKMHEILKLIPKEKMMEIPKEILEVIPATEDALKGYIINKKYFKQVLPGYFYKEEYQDVFKLCFVLGLFSNPKENLEFIEKIIGEIDIDDIHQMFTNVELDCYKPKYKELFIELYNDKKTDYLGDNILGRLYSSFEKINKYTIKRHEDDIGKKNTQIRRLKELGANTILLEKELENLKKNKKNISYEDIVYYIKNNTFDIREGNEDLKDVTSILSVHMEQPGFDVIQDIYEESRNIEKTIPLTNDISGNDIKYHWSRSDNPINTVLGYLVNCCAKLDGAGEDIMRQSMINPDIANLIIYDENNQVMGKATAYYNRKGKYILFNNAETKEIASKGLKSTKQREKECLEALIRGAMDAVKALKERGEDIKEVRIGMLRNDLANVIEEYGLEISYELLQSYNWKDYAGDASDTARGQAIIYKDDEFDKNKNI